MPELTEFTEPSPAPLGRQDFNADLARAEATGDFKAVIASARDSHKFFMDIRDAIKRGQFQGEDIQILAAAFKMIETMIGQAAGTLAMVKAMERNWKPQGPEQPPEPPPPPEPAPSDKPETEQVHA